jgi:hypothetical protein
MSTDEHRDVSGGKFMCRCGWPGIGQAGTRETFTAHQRDARQQPENHRRETIGSIPKRQPATGVDAINERWYPGRNVWIAETGEAVMVIRNRIYATDCGAFVRYTDGKVDVIHWTRLTLENP